MQPHIANATNNGHVIIDIVKDENTTKLQPIVLNVYNITITKAQGNNFFVLFYTFHFNIHLMYEHAHDIIAAV